MIFLGSTAACLGWQGAILAQVDTADERMNASPHLTLIVPIYNSPGDLSRLLHSLANVQVGPRWDVVVVDDGSAVDLRPHVADGTALGLPITYHRLATQSGPGAARNAGLKLAGGTHVAFVDVDDEPSVPDLIAVMDSAHSEYVAVAAGRYVLTGRRSCTAARPRQQSQLGDSREGDWSRRLMEYPAVWSFVFRRDMLLKTGITFPDTSYAEDLVFLIRLSRLETSFLQTDRTVYRHVLSQTKGATSASNSSTTASHVREALAILDAEYHEAGSDQRAAIISWQLRIAGRQLFARGNLRPSDRRAILLHVLGVIVWHPLESVRTAARWSSLVLSRGLGQCMSKRTGT